MTIRLRLVFSAAAVMLALITLILVQIGTTARVGNLLDRREQVDRVVQGVFDLNLLVSDYLLHGEDRARQQWTVRHSSLAELVDTMAPVSERDGRLLEMMDERLRSLETLFAEIVAIHPGPGTSSPREALLRGRLLGSSQELASIARTLSDRTKERIERTQWAGRIAVIAAGALAAVTIAIILYALARSVLDPLRKVREGAEEISAGRLTHRIGSESRDEIGDLSRTFDRMAENLRTLTVSRDELTREVAERERAERRAERNAEELASSNRELEQFAYIASHDLQEPLRKVQMFVDRLQTRHAEQLGEQGQDYLDRVLNSTARMPRLVSRLSMPSSGEKVAGSSSDPGPAERRARCSHDSNWSYW